MYKFFSKVGIEPTFTIRDKDYPVLTFPEVRQLAGVVWDVRYEITRALATTLSCEDGWLGNATTDDLDVEIPSPDQYTTLEGLMRDYRRLVAKVQKYRLYPSAVVDYYNDGGCHINVDVNHIERERGSKFFETFNHNLVAFLNTYPSLVWSMLTPNDNISSKVFPAESFRGSLNIWQMTGKGWCANYREPHGDRYWELRFFMMPRNDEEMIFQLKVADNFIRLIYKLTENGMEVKPINSASKLKAYSFKKAKQELEQVAQWLHMEGDPMWKEKLISLRERIEVQGKHFLV
jgi:hypothetical protein